VRASTRTFSIARSVAAAPCAQAQTVLAVDPRPALVGERAARLRLLVGEDDAGARLGRGERGGETGRTRADHQHVAMGVARGIAVGVGLLRRVAEAGGGADHRLVDPFPGRLRPHEGLVVEAGREERRGEAVERADVEAERRPAVLRHGLQAVIELLHGGAHIGRDAPGIAADADQRVRLLRARAEHAARPVILERAPHEMDAVGEERRGERVAFEPGEVLPVEGEARDARRRQPAMAGDAEGTAHAPSPSRTGFGSPAL